MTWGITAKTRVPGINSLTGRPLPSSNRCTRPIQDFGKDIPFIVKKRYGKVTLHGKTVK